jgi:hypothetical protein
MDRHHLPDAVFCRVRKYNLQNAFGDRQFMHTFYGSPPGRHSGIGELERQVAGCFSDASPLHKDGFDLLAMDSIHFSASLSEMPLASAGPAGISGLKFSLTAMDASSGVKRMCRISSMASPLGAVEGCESGNFPELLINIHRRPPQ